MERKNKLRKKMKAKLIEGVKAVAIESMKRWGREVQSADCDIDKFLLTAQAEGAAAEYTARIDAISGVSFMLFSADKPTTCERRRAARERLLRMRGVTETALQPNVSTGRTSHLSHDCSDEVVKELAKFLRQINYSSTS